MTDLGRMHNMHDRDDLLAEQVCVCVCMCTTCVYACIMFFWYCEFQAERELRMKLDNAFSSFCRKLEAMPQCHVEFEKPFRELGYVI